MVTNAGVESLTATGYSDGCIRFETAAYSWAKNVEVTTWTGEGVAINDSFRIELRDSYIHDAAWPEPGGAGYAISLANGSSEVLIENNISMMANKVMVARCAGAGSVVGYNYVDDGLIPNRGELDRDRPERKPHGRPPPHPVRGQLRFQLGQRRHAR